MWDSFCLSLPKFKFILFTFHGIHVFLFPVLWRWSKLTRNVYSSSWFPYFPWRVNCLLLYLPMFLIYNEDTHEVYDSNRCKIMGVWKQIEVQERQNKTGNSNWEFVLKKGKGHHNEWAFCQCTVTAHQLSEIYDLIMMNSWTCNTIKLNYVRLYMLFSLNVGHIEIYWTRKIL